MGICVQPTEPAHRATYLEHPLITALKCMHWTQCQIEKNTGSTPFLSTPCTKVATIHVTIKLLLLYIYI